MKYHGTPLSGSNCDAAKILRGRHALVSFAHPKQLEIVTAVCESFVLDNGAFTQWKRGTQVDWSGYYSWVRSLKNHPRFDWAIIPDVIDGDAGANDDLLAQWPHDLRHVGVPVWHMHEPVERLVSLAERYPRVAIGSSGEFSTVGSKAWHQRMDAAMDAVCDGHGQPVTKLHGLRMLDPKIMERYPLASADSTNMARNIGLDVAWTGRNAPADLAVRGFVMAERIDATQGAERWVKSPQDDLFSLEVV